MIKLEYPFKEETIRSLRAGDSISLSGKVFTGRDRFHKHLADGGECPVEMRDAALFHCGPVMVPDGDGWRVVAAGPTTSIREEPYEAFAIEKLWLRVIIGKGGMGERTAEACRRFGCVYLQAVGGAAALIADRVVRVNGVSFLEEFGATEAVWEFEFENLSAVVGIDAAGGDIFAETRRTSTAELRRLTGK